MCLYVCIKLPFTQTCGFAERPCEAGTQNAFDDRNRMEINWSTAITRLDTLYDT